MRSRTYTVAASVIAATLSSAGQAQSAGERVQFGPVPSWVTPMEMLPVPAEAAGMAFVRYNQVVAHVDSRGVSQYLAYRVRLLHPNALQLGNVAIAWQPAAGSPVVHFVRVHRDGQVTDALANGRFEVIRREDQLELARLNGTLTAVMRIPELRVGDEIELGVTLPGTDPTLGNTVASVIAMVPQPQPGRYHLEVSWTADRQPTVRATSDLTSHTERGERFVRVRWDNPPAAPPPAAAPGRYNWQRLIEISDFPTWQAVSARFAPLYATASALAPNSPLSAEARRIASASADPVERMRAALALVQRDVRYIYVGLNNGNLTPATADESWQRRWADCKGKTALLLALLRELDVPAEAVLVNTTPGFDGLDARLPSPAWFDHVIVRARVGGETYWLDGTLPDAAVPSLRPIAPYRSVLPLAVGGAGLEARPWEADRRPSELFLWDLDARAGFDQPARINMTVITRGLDGLAQYAQMSSLTPAQRLEAVRREMAGGMLRDVESIDWRYDRSTGASVLRISGLGELDWDREGGRSELVLPGGGFSPPSRRERPIEQDRTLPYVTDTGYRCDVTVLRLPRGTDPQAWQVNRAFNTRLFGRNYYRAFDRRSDSIRMVRASRSQQAEVTVEEATRDNARIAAFDNSMARVEYDPAARSTTPATRGVSIPAPDEIDWVTQDAACMPPGSAPAP